MGSIIQKVIDGFLIIHDLQPQYLVGSQNNNNESTQNVQ